MAGDESGSACTAPDTAGNAYVYVNAPPGTHGASTGSGARARTSGSPFSWGCIVSGRKLPVLADASPFMTLQRRERELARLVDGLSLDELRRSPRGKRYSLLSANAKTSVSLDMPIGQTCTPTPVCAAVCYGTRSDSPLSWTKSIVARLRNLRRLKLSNTEQFVEDLERDFAIKQRMYAKRGVKLDFLRINGVGDLTEELVAVVNLFVARNPGVKVWVVTRKFDLAATIAPAQNLFLELSLDSSTSRADLAAAWCVVEQHPRAFTSYLRKHANDDTLAAAIIFDEKRTEGLPHDSRLCPVDARKLPLGNVRGKGGTACARCRRCFVESVLIQQRDLSRFGAKQAAEPFGNKKTEAARPRGVQR